MRRRLTVPIVTLSPFSQRLIHAYRTQRPKVNITPLELSSSLQIDVGLLRLPESALPINVVFTPLIEEPLLLAMHAGHRLANVPSIKLKDLHGEPFIAYARQVGVTVYEQAAALCAKRGLEPQVVQEAQQASTLIGLTATARRCACAGNVADHCGTRCCVQTSGRDGHHYYAVHRSSLSRRQRPGNAVCRVGPGSSISL